MLLISHNVILSLIKNQIVVLCTHIRASERQHVRMFGLFQKRGGKELHVTNYIYLFTLIKENPIFFQKFLFFIIKLLQLL